MKPLTAIILELCSQTLRGWEVSLPTYTISIYDFVKGNPVLAAREITSDW
jgi:hypothetical protein